MKGSFCSTLLSRQPYSWTAWLCYLHYQLLKGQPTPCWTHLRVMVLHVRDDAPQWLHKQPSTCRQTSGPCVQVQKFPKLQRILFALLSPQISLSVTVSHASGKRNSGLLGSPAKPQSWLRGFPWRSHCAGWTHSPPICQTALASVERTF